ncbi:MULTISPECIES: TRAP transporter large permease [Halomonadaceae]|uniref:TRAP transporter large permease subunit n=1 Tax=Vreelandella maris TaxID=2729617 RepID=A0A7Y6RBR5_9GAMM|nr:TRAP transporter large permease subunit [Halomonas maris]NVF13946.1 TRAP transporter large permease subunit [Halomonas maris]|tara:strand:- start:2359 stop:3669 length:1311 start_codon:yes stop_codon:yes gene_type:complete
MEWYWILTVSFLFLLGLMATGLPVFVAFLIANVTGVLVTLGERGFGMFSNSMYETLTSESFITIPLFVLMGEILFRSGSVDVLSSALDKWIGRVNGRMYYLVIALSTIFGALSGAAAAVAAMLGRSILPQMQKLGYDTNLTNFTILGGASLAPIIPPSLLVIVIGSLVRDTSIAGLLIAGIIPGLLISLILFLYVYIRVARNPELSPDNNETVKNYSIKEKLIEIIKVSPFFIVIFSVMGLILLGVATPSEAAATGVIGAIITAAIYKSFHLKMLWESLQSSTKISLMIVIIVASSKLFGQLLSFMGATSGLIDFVSTLELSDWMMFFVLMLIPFILCMFIDQFAFILLAIPLYAPVVSAYDFDPIWFWTIFLINLTVGSLTPPFGYTLFALKGSADSVLISDIYKSSWPVVILFMSSILLFYFFPAIITFLPSIL